MRVIVKREGHEELYDERKVYASCYAACLSAHIQKENAENICDSVTHEIRTWLSEKSRVDSDELFKKTTDLMSEHNKDASFMYETHRDVS